jgi:hypothetical protein
MSKKFKWLPNANTPTVLPLTKMEAPEVYFTAEAWRKVNYIVEQCSSEIAWLGIVDQLTDGNYLITKIYIPKQEVTGVTAEIDHDSMAKLVLKVMDDGYDVEQLRYHGHSHVNMGVVPSAVDQDHIAGYLEGDQCDFFLRSINNKKGEMKMDIFDKRLGVSGVAYQCVNTEIWESCQTQEWYDAVDAEIKENALAPKPTANNNLYSRGYFGNRSWAAPGNVLSVNGTENKPANTPRIDNNESLVADVMEYLGDLDEPERDKWLRSLSSEDRAVVSAAFNSYSVGHG